MSISLILRCALLLVVSANASATVITRRESKLVAVSQTVAGPAAGAKSKTDITVGVTTQVRGAMAMAKGSVRVSDQGAGTFVGMPANDYSKLTKTVCTPVYYKLQNDYLDSDGSGGGCQEVSFGEGDVTAAFDQAIDTRAPQLMAQLGALIKVHGAASGVYTFEQELSSAALGGRRRLVWTAIMDPSGKLMFGKSKIVSATQFYIYITYTPLTVSPKLPQSWQYPNPGTLGWVLVNSKMQALEPGTLIDTGGFFDEPAEQTGVGNVVKCLIDHSNAGCGAQYPDVVTLLAQSGAAGAYIDFLHAVEPRYLTIESPAGSGDYTAVAELTLNVPSRSVTTQFDPTCLIKSYTYATSGTYQFNLNHSMTRFFVEKGKVEYKSVAEISSKVVSPAQSYSAAMGVSEDSLGALPGLYIDPFGEEGPLVDIGLLPPGSGFASIDYLPPPVCTPVVPPVPTGP